ncbi:MAG: signal peptidase II [Firmicutes bacterium]|nr:signal peptidase II [Bacillota bacterium]
MESKVYGVIFKNNSKAYYFKSTLDIDMNTEVIVITEKGEQYGKVVSLVNTPKEDEYKEIVRIATREDTDNYYKNLKDAEDALNKCKELVNELGLNMFVINASYNFDRSQLLINFSADDRVDFRELARKLASVYKTRIELRQIGARDKAKQVGGIGVCGQKLCCANFLNQIESISMNKAKNQNLALNPAKINGACGRLLCCLCYEDEEYTRCSKGLLHVGCSVKYNGSVGIIVGVDILTRTYKILIDDEKLTVKAEEVEYVSKK